MNKNELIQHDDNLEAEITIEKRRISTKQKLIFSSILVVIMVLSITVFSQVTTNPDNLARFQESLSSQQEAVAVMAATSAALSAAISLIPSDAGSPIANELASMSSYFIVILAAIFLQKMLLSFVGYFSFFLVIPAACVIGIGYLFTNKAHWRNLAIKLAAFGLTIFFAIPVAVMISSAINTTFISRLEDPSDTTITGQNDEVFDGIFTDFENDISETDANGVSDSLPADSPDTEGDRTFFGRALDAVSGTYDSARGAVTGAYDTARDAVTGAYHYFENKVVEASRTFNFYIKKTAIFMVTSTVIPILVIALFGWVVKMFFGLDLQLMQKGKKMQMVVNDGIGFVNKKIHQVNGENIGK